MQAEFPPSQQQVLFPQPVQDQTLHQGSDPNSPEVFKQNIHLVQAHVARLQSLARSALSGVQNAYYPGNNPMQTNADITSLKQTLGLLTDIMRHTGVGALPLLPLPMGTEAAEPSSLPSEQIWIIEASRAVQAQFERSKRIQDAAVLAGNVMQFYTQESASRLSIAKLP